MSSRGAADDSRGVGRRFPQGMVLGLTMAETTVLVIFVLLLAMSVLLSRAMDRAKQAEEDARKYALVEGALAEQGMGVAEFLDSLGTPASPLAQANDWRELMRKISPHVRDPTPRGVLTEVPEALKDRNRESGFKNLDDALAAAGFEPTPANLASLVEVVRAAAESALDPASVRRAIEAYGGLVDEIGREQIATADPDAVSDDELVGLVRDAASWRRQKAAEPQGTGDGAGPGGTGTDNPSCWYDRDGTVAYLFDVALTDRGFILKDAQAPQHDAKRATLPLDRIDLGRALTPEEFVRQTLPVFRWSVEKACRFFVRAFDRTGPAEKELYKVRMRTLEGHFYKNASPTGPSPF